MDDITQLNNFKGTEHRAYQFRNLIRPSVSWATGHVVPPSRLRFFKEVSFENQERISGDAAELGTLFHGYAESILKGNVVDDVVPPLKKAVQNFRDWFEKAKPIVYHTENKIFSTQYGYGGTMDAVLGIGGKKTLVDWKTGKYSDMDLWKTEAYRRAWFEMTGELLDVSVYYFPRNGDPMKNYTIRHHDFCFNMFLSCLNTWKGIVFNDRKGMGFELDFLTKVDFV